MKFWEIGKRNLKEISRNPVLLGFLLGMPVAFMLVFIAAAGGAQASPIALSIVDEDRSQNSSAFIQYLGSVDAIELNEPLYSEESQAQEDLEDGKISFYLLIPSGFQQAQQVHQPINLELVYKEADPMTGLQLKPIIEAVGSGFLGVAPPLNVELRGTASIIKNQAVNFYFPGIAVYGFMILISTAAGIIAGDREKGFLSRMFTTPARPSDFILGYSLPFIPVLIVSALVYLGVGMGLGLTVVGNYRDRHDSGQLSQKRVSNGCCLDFHRSHGHDLRGLVHSGPYAFGCEKRCRGTSFHPCHRRLPLCPQRSLLLSYHTRYLLAHWLGGRPICDWDYVIQKDDGELGLFIVELVF
jgi:hypothetical protein